MKSLYAKYVEERRGAYVIEEEYGFISFELRPTYSTIFIRDLYILPEYRRKGLGTDITYAILNTIDKEELHKYKFAMANTDKTSNNWQLSEKMILANGFSLFKDFSTYREYIRSI